MPPRWLDQRDAWITARLRDTPVHDAEPRVMRAIAAGMREWFAQARKVVLPGDEDTEPSLDAWPDRSVWTTLLQNAVLPISSAVFGEAFRQLIRSNTPGQVGLNMTQYRRPFLEKVSDRLSRNLWPDGVFEEVRYELQEGMQDGATVSELRDRIGRVLQIDAPSRQIRAQINELKSEGKPVPGGLYDAERDADNAWHYPARRIARTELLTSYNGGTHQGGYRLQEVLGKQLFKSWIATTDSRVRDWHWVAYRQTQPLDEPFLVGGEYLDFPGDPQGSAANTIQCRCTTVHLDSGEADEERARYEAELPHRTDIEGRPLVPDATTAAAEPTSDSPEDTEPGDETPENMTADAEAAAEPEPVTTPLAPGGPWSVPADSEIDDAAYPVDDPDTDGPPDALEAAAGDFTSTGTPSARKRHRAEKSGAAMKGGRYPIENGRDLEKAIRALGRAKGGNRGRAAVKRHIIKRARALHLVSKLPDAWRTTTAQSGMPSGLQDYWVHGEGAAKIRWGTDGAFDRCVRQVREYVSDPEGTCANLEHEATGHWPAEEALPSAATAAALDTEGTQAMPYTWAEQVSENVPAEPPVDWFNDPQLTGPTKIRVSEDGRVYGHVAAWGVEHASIPGVTAPRHGGQHGYGKFHRHPVRTADGRRVNTGPLASAGHADVAASLGEVIQHYDDPLYVIADVTAGEDDHGLWVSGSLRPGVSPHQVMMLDRYSISGDWRQGELVAACSVSVPGFELPADDSVVALAAAAGEGRPLLPTVEPAAYRDTDGELAAIVAAGVVAPNPGGNAAQRATVEQQAHDLIRSRRRAQSIEQTVTAAARRMAAPTVEAAARRIQKGDTA